MSVLKDGEVGAQSQESNFYENFVLPEPKVISASVPRNVRLSKERNFFSEFITESNLNVEEFKHPNFHTFKVVLALVNGKSMEAEIAVSRATATSKNDAKSMAGCKLRRGNYG